MESSRTRQERVEAEEVAEAKSRSKTYGEARHSFKGETAHEEILLVSRLFSDGWACGPKSCGTSARVQWARLEYGNLSRLSHAKTRSISPENLTGEKGKGGMATEGTGAEAARGLGQGWKISPSIKIEPKKTFTLGEIQGPGAIQHIWMTPAGNFRFSIVRMYWDGEATPSVEVPVGDLFACGWGRYAQVSSLAVCVNPGSGLNSYWQMPFRKSAKLTLENLDDVPMTIYYQIDYVLTEVPEDAAYFHAQFRRSNPLPYKNDHVILDGVKGWGQYVGTYLAWGVHNTGWWGEGARIRN